jgi:hypothetical protein
MRAVLILVSAVTFGLAGGYAWSAITGPKPHAFKAAKATSIAVPASPEERPAALDQEWAARAVDSGPVAEAQPETRISSTDTVEHSAVYYPNCDTARAAGAAPITAGQPGYRAALDADGDGIACEPYRG